MKPKLLCVFLLLSMLAAREGFAQGPKLQIDHLSRLADKAKEVVDVKLGESMLQQASAMGGKQPDARAKAALEGLKGVYVKSFKFTSPGEYSDADVEAVRAQLKAPGWSRIVSIRDEKELAEVCIWSDAKGSGGLAIIVAEPQELTVVNLVGRINIAQLGALTGQLGIPDVPGMK